jgi:hypothetical protein
MQGSFEKLAMLQPKRAPVYDEVASLIAPTETPAWLRDLLSDWAPTVALSRGVHAQQPTKTEMRKKLINVSNAATCLFQSLQDTATKEFLETEGSVRIENIGGLQNALQKIGECAATATNSPRISATPTTARRGTGKALPEGAYSPLTFCAVFVSEVWKHLHYDYPAPTNRKAAAAAHAYWQATGGEIVSWGSDPLSRWKHQFKMARSPEIKKIRLEIQRHCREHSREQAMLSGVGIN